MRYCILILAIGVCALLASPVAAQQARPYQPTTSQEVQRLERLETPELVAVRGGDSTRDVALDSAERAELDTLAAEQSQELQFLRELRGGVHVVYIIAIPCIVVVAVVAIILILVLT